MLPSEKLLLKKDKNTSNLKLKVYNMEREIWKAINDYPRYLVSNKGRIKSIAFTQLVIPKTKKKYIREQAEKILSVNGKREGYPFVNLTNNSGSKAFSIHRLVAIAFIPNIYNKPLINHIDNSRDNNNFINLEWCTYSQNIKHAINQDRHPSVTKQDKIKLLVSKWESGIYKLKDLAKEQNMNVGSMAHLLYRNSNYRKIKLLKRENSYLFHDCPKIEMPSTEKECDILLNRLLFDK